MSIDTHAHYVPRSLIDRARRDSSQLGVNVIDGAGSTPALAFSYGFKVRPFFPKLVESAEARFAWLDSQKLDRQFVATWPDIYGYGLPHEQCVLWHRMLNDTLAEWCDENARRMSFVASVPLPNGADAASELDRAASLGAVAVMIPANVEGKNIGEFDLNAFWQRAVALHLPVMIHPVATVPFPRAGKFGLAQIANYTFDTTLGIGSILFSGVLDRFPSLTLVLAHGGGAFPYLAGRFDIMHARMDKAAQGDVAQKPPSAYAATMVYDTIVHSPKTMKFLGDFAGVSQLVLGTDYSFPPADLTPIESLRAAGFGAAQITAIADENPRRLFRRLTK